MLKENQSQFRHFNSQLHKATYLDECGVSIIYSQDGLDEHFLQVAKRVRMTKHVEKCNLPPVQMNPLFNQKKIIATKR